MNDYCRRGVRAGCELAEATGGSCTAITLGPTSADTVLREAILCGCAGGIHVSDPAFAGSDTLATARALATALERCGPWDLVLCGRNSVDADTGQVPAQLAEMLGLPLLTGARQLEVDGDTVHALLEHDDEWVRVEVDLPAVVSCAERLCDPCKVKDPEAWATVDPALIELLDAADLGPGPWGADGSPTRVGRTRLLDVDRAGERLDEVGPGQVARVLEVLRARGVFDADIDGPADEVARPVGDGDGGDVVVLGEPGRHRMNSELLGAGAGLAAAIGGRCVMSIDVVDDWEALSGQGVDKVLRHAGTIGAEDVAGMLESRLNRESTWAVLAPGTAWGREVAARLATRLGAGLTGDAIGLEARDGRLVAFKPAFGGQMVAEITCTSAVQMATVRPGILPGLRPRPNGPFAIEHLDAVVGSRTRIIERHRDDDRDLLANAAIVIGVGAGVAPTDLPEIEAHAAAIGAELCATRRVTDAGWMPRARQVGITGHSIAPRLYLAIGTSGKFNHTVGVRSAGTVVGINPDPDCELWSACDIGMVGDWRTAMDLLIPGLVHELAR
jgi:electron transfer flavoprotein alpha subunit